MWLPHAGAGGSSWCHGAAAVEFCTWTIGFLQHHDWLDRSEIGKKMYLNDSLFGWSHMQR
jgi:hypothetical protein